MDKLEEIEPRKATKTVHKNCGGRIYVIKTRLWLLWRCENCGDDRDIPVSEAQRG